ncbi:LPP20 family lipoprotein [Salicola sp. Rm-C-2C1-2]|uniref:LPP20 family lipoprotein n=1 Tax=Salicola sp. Rm-C-2C1-2 TaxID=3141321 RepID=UPI0032E4501A
MNPPSDDARSIHGVGEGNSMEDARGNALGVIAGKLKTRVKSELETEQVLEDGEESSFTRNKVQTTTEALELSDYEVLKSAAGGGRRFVLLEVNRPNLVRSMKSELETLNEELEASLEGEQQASLTRLYQLNRSEPQIREALALASLITSVGQNVNLSEERVRYNGLLAERERLLQTLRIGIQTDAETAELGDHVTRMLLDKGIHADRLGQGEAYSGVLRISGKSERADMFDEKHVSLNVKLNLLNEQGESVTTSRYKGAASSLSDYASARVSANRVIAEKINEQGIWKALKLKEGN